MGRVFLPGKGSTMVTPRNALSGVHARLAVVGVLVLIGTLVIASAAQAAVSISRAELGGSQLRLEGSASANRAITVDGVAMGTSDGSGRFRIERSGFAAPADCTVDVNDGSASPTVVRLSGCTPSAPRRHRHLRLRLRAIHRHPRRPHRRQPARSFQRPSQTATSGP